MPVIVGSPRSGTTLLRFMIDAHPLVAIPPETGFLPAVGILDVQGHANADSLHELITGFPAEAPNWADFGLSVDAFRSALSALHPFDVAAGVRCFYRLYAQANGKPRWGDKAPVHTRHLAEIFRLLPEARFVHILRDGRDAALSLRPLWFAPGRDMTSLANQWMADVRAARAAGSALPHYLEVRYERLVMSPEAELRRICAFLELPFAAEMLRYFDRTPERLREHGERRRADGSLLVSREQRLRQQALTLQPPQPERAGRWRREMTPPETADYERVAGELLAELGYPLAASAAPLEP